MGTRLAKPAIDVGLVTVDAAPLLAFYEALLGAERLDPLEIPSVGRIHKLVCGESVLRVMVPATPPTPGDGEPFSARTGIRYLTFEVEDLDAAVESVRAHDGSVALEPFELRPGRRVAQVADPDGNMIELGQG